MLSNQKIVLTGANSGIGFEILKLLTTEKSNTIFAVDLHLDKIENYSVNVLPYQCDVSSKANVDAFFEAALEAMGEITLFYANAGYPYYEVIDYVDWDRTQRIFETNVFSPIYSFEKYKAYLNGRPGHFAVTVSAIGKMAMPGFTLYSATKFAVHGFQQGIRLEMSKNMKLTCLYPIATDTNFFKAANKEKFERPFPVQSPEIVARKMVKGLEKGKKSVSPSILFSISMVLFKILPFTRTIYWNMEKAKLRRFVESQVKKTN
jgi:short-subunit dehydrogenase